MRMSKAAVPVVLSLAAAGALLASPVLAQSAPPPSPLGGATTTSPGTRLSPGTGDATGGQQKTKHGHRRHAKPATGSDSQGG